MQFDDILPMIGQFGLYQLLTMMGSCFYRIFLAFQTVSIVFTGARMDFWCNDPVADSFNMTGLNVCNTSCKTWAFSSEGNFKTTWRSDFGLVCNKEKFAGISTTFYMLGLLIGSTGYGIFSDRYGRVPAASAAFLHMWIAGVALAFSPRLEVFIALKFLSGIGTAGAISVGNTHLSELVSARYRLPIVLVVSNGWNFGMAILSLIAYAIRDHRQLELTLASPAILAVGVVLLIGESPRWLLARNRPHDAFIKCKRIARINRRSLPEKFSEDIKAVTNTLVSQQGQNPHVSIADLLRSRMRRPTLVLWYHFFASSMIYYGLILSSGSLKGDIYVIFLLVSLVGVPATLFTVVAAKILGRPLMFFVSNLLAAACLLTIAFLKTCPGYEVFVVVLALSGRFLATVVVDGGWAYSSEMFPTLVRNTGMGSSSTASRVGGILAPVVNMLSSVWRPLPFVIFAAVSLVASVLDLLLPETKGKRLPESLRDADKEYTMTKLESLTSYAECCVGGIIHEDEVKDEI